MSVLYALPKVKEIGAEKGLKLPSNGKHYGTILLLKKGITLIKKSK